MNLRITDDEEIEKLVERVKRGKNSQDIIVNYNDALLTTYHCNLPIDAISNSRDETTI